jgi:hypothetical protein
LIAVGKSQLHSPAFKKAQRRRTLVISPYGPNFSQRLDFPDCHFLQLVTQSETVILVSAIPNLEEPENVWKSEPSSRKQAEHLGYLGR